MERVVGGTVSGSILLFHNDLENTTEALPTILTTLAKQGLEFVPVSELIYTEDYTLDSSGMQVKNVSAIGTVASYTSNAVLNDALERMRQNLTMEEIYSLTAGAAAVPIEKITSFLTEEQIWIIQNMSYDELKEAVGALIAVAEQEGAGGGAAEEVADTTEQEVEVIEETSPVPETTPPVETSSLPDKQAEETTA